MSEADSEEVKRAQTRILEILRAFDAFCVENGISYFALGGTLLGAVRHGGFIPWDDDVDVGVPRCDYDRLLQLAANMPAPFKLEAHELDRAYIYPYAKVYDTNSIVTEDYIEPFTRGLWIDVFPIDGSYESRAMRWAHFKAIKFVNSLTFLKLRAYQAPDRQRRRAFIKRLVAACSQPLPEVLFRRTTDWLLRRRSPSTSAVVGNLLGRWGARELVPREVMFPGTKVKFCDLEIQAPASPDLYLRSIYADYMKLPPPHLRCSGHHFLRVDLEHSYLKEQIDACTK